jgi:hypothetical protein
MQTKDITPVVTKEANYHFRRLAMIDDASEKTLKARMALRMQLRTRRNCQSRRSAVSTYADL